MQTVEQQGLNAGFSSFIFWLKKQPLSQAMVRSALLIKANSSSLELYGVYIFCGGFCLTGVEFYALFLEKKAKRVGFFFYFQMRSFYLAASFASLYASLLAFSAYFASLQAYFSFYFASLYCSFSIFNFSLAYLSISFYFYLANLSLSFYCCFSNLSFSFSSLYKAFNSFSLSFSSLSFQISYFVLLCLALISSSLCLGFILFYQLDLISYWRFYGVFWPEAVSSLGLTPSAVYFFIGVTFNSTIPSFFSYPSSAIASSPSPSISGEIFNLIKPSSLLANYIYRIF